MPGAPQNPMMQSDAEAGVRVQDEQKMDCLLGGDDDFDRPRYESNWSKNFGSRARQNPSSGYKPSAGVPRAAGRVAAAAQGYQPSARVNSRGSNRGRPPAVGNQDADLERAIQASMAHYRGGAADFGGGAAAYGRGGSNPNNFDEDAMLAAAMEQSLLDHH